jgi:1,4-alpha-glucan branching enzyme
MSYNYSEDQINQIKKHCLVILDYIYNHNIDIYNQIAYFYPELYTEKGKNLKTFIWNNRDNIIEYILNKDDHEIDGLILDALTTYDYMKNNSTILGSKNNY